ncbi:MAG: TRAP transporter small permease [Thermotoga sp.]|nr:MAG: TRAP transporter small permease [Thermotoga sp.]RKX54929.1 MAG: TRAP transporter small permease [Thermotoga sp.]
MKFLKKLIKVTVDIVEIHLSSIFLFAVFATMFLQVWLRYIFRMPSPQLYEITQYSFVWTVLLGAAFAHRYRDHIRFNIIYEKLPRKMQLVIDIVFDLLMVVLFSISLKPIFRQAFWYHMIRSEVLGIPWTYLVLCLPLFLIFVIGHNIVFLYYEFRELFTGKPMKTEEKPWL